jgi:hypothetical protein
MSAGPVTAEYKGALYLEDVVEWLGRSGQDQRIGHPKIFLLIFYVMQYSNFSHDAILQRATITLYRDTSRKQWRQKDRKYSV